MGDKYKAYSIEFDHRGAYLHVTVGGAKVTPKIALAYWQEIIDECEANRFSKILLDHNFSTMIDMAEMLQIIGPIGDLLKGRILAFFDRHGNNDIPEAGKMILRSHDMKVQIFDNLKDAERWLLAN